MPDLYRMYDRGNRLLYVGISFNAGTRATQHATDKPWWPHVATITVEHLSCPWDEALAIEKRTIHAERPIHNKIHNTGDEYVERLTLKPFLVPRELVDKPAWRRLMAALAEVAHVSRHVYGMRSLGDPESTAPVNVLELIEAQARAAHLPFACMKCGRDAVSHHVRVIYGHNNDTSYRIGAVCTDPTCTSGAGSNHLSWEET